MKLVNTKTAADTLGVSEQTIYKYVKLERLSPVNFEDWKIDGSYLFLHSDILTFKEQLQKPGLTTGEAAKLLGVSTITINNYIKKKKIRAKMEMYNGKKQYFIDEAEIIKICEQKTSDDQAIPYCNRTGFGLFQLFKNSETNEIARIIKIENHNITLITPEWKQYPWEYLEPLGYKPAYKIPTLKRTRKKGVITFSIHLKHLLSQEFTMIDFLYRFGGHNRIDVRIVNEEIHVAVKPCFLSLDIKSYQQELETMKKHLKTGKFVTRKNGVLFKSDLESMTIHLHSNIKNELKKRAASNETNLEDYVGAILENSIKKK